VASSTPFSGPLSSSSSYPFSLTVVAVAMKGDASLRVSLVLSAGRLLLRGWKDSSEPRGIGQGGLAHGPVAHHACVGVGLRVTRPVILHHLCIFNVRGGVVKGKVVPSGHRAAFGRLWGLGTFWSCGQAGRGALGRARAAVDGANLQAVAGRSLPLLSVLYPS
jgi:hypothetical protein